MAEVLEQFFEPVDEQEKLAKITVNAVQAAIRSLKQGRRHVSQKKRRTLTSDPGVPIKG